MKKSIGGLLVCPEHLVLYDSPFLRTLTCPSQPSNTSTEPLFYQYCCMEVSVGCPRPEEAQQLSSQMH